MVSVSAIRLRVCVVYVWIYALIILKKSTPTPTSLAVLVSIHTQPFAYMYLHTHTHDVDQHNIDTYFKLHLQHWSRAPHWTYHNVLEQSLLCASLNCSGRLIHRLVLSPKTQSDR